MATKKVCSCDRCGVEIKHGNLFGLNLNTHRSVFGIVFGTYKKHFDLCEKCGAKLWYWIDNAITHPNGKRDMTDEKFMSDCCGPPEEK